MAWNVWDSWNEWAEGGNSASVVLAMPAPSFSVYGGSVTNYPIASVSFIIDKPSFKDNVYSNSFGQGFNKSMSFSNGVIKSSIFNGVEK